MYDGKTKKTKYAYDEHTSKSLDRLCASTIVGNPSFIRFVHEMSMLVGTSLRKFEMKYIFLLYKLYCTLYTQLVIGRS